MSDGTQPSVRVVRPTSEQLGEVASLRWRQAVGSGRDGPVSHDEFVHDFVRWIRTHEASHQCMVALSASCEVMAFGFLALVSRVPSPHASERVSADVQAVFVRPELRNRGIGAQIIDSLLQLARSRGAEHVTVHSSVEAVTAYRRAGFTADPLMLNLMLGSDRPP